jgi:hypothetical protein
MVLPTRRSSVQQVTMEGQDPTEQGGKRTAGTFPGTPHPQKRMRCKDNGDTPPTEETATEEQAAAAYDEVSFPMCKICICTTVVLVLYSCHSCP